MSSEEMCQVCPAIVCVSESGTVLGARDTSVKGVLLAFKTGCWGTADECAQSIVGKRRGR